MKTDYSPTPFRTFGARGADRPQNSFRTLFAILGPKGPNEPCSGREFAKAEGMYSGKRQENKDYSLGPEIGRSGEALPDNGDGGRTVRSLPRKFVFLGFESDSETGVFWKRGLFSKVHFLEILENFEVLEILESPQTLENKGESNHFLEILEIPPVNRPFRNDPFFRPSVRKGGNLGCPGHPAVFKQFAREAVKILLRIFIPNF